MVVLSLAVLPNGDVLAMNNGLHRWNGSTWSDMPTPLGTTVEAFAVGPDGSIAASVSNGFTPTIMIWNGVSWNGVGTLSGNGQVKAMAWTANGDLIVGGRMTTINDVNVRYVGKWNGSTWSELSGLSSIPVDIAPMPDGGIIVAGDFGNRTVMRWDGSSWASVGDLPAGAFASIGIMPNGDVAFGGSFSFGSPVRARNISRWDGSAWKAFNSGNDGAIQCLLEEPNGDLLAGGSFTTIEGVHANGLARRSNGVWSVVAGSPAGTFYDLERAPNGDVIAAGGFATYSVARFDGSNWTPLAAGVMAGGARVVLPLSNGELIAGGGGFAMADPVVLGVRIVRWNGSSWSSMGTISNGTVLALAQMPSGDIIAGGTFTFANPWSVSRIARWNGTSWIPIDTGVNGDVAAMEVLPGGDLLIAGSFTSAGGVPAAGLARWGVGGWSQFGGGVATSTGAAGSVSTIKKLADGRIMISGAFASAGGVAADRIAIWDGAAWSGFDRGVSANALAILPGGGLFAGGNFATAGDEISAYFAEWACNPVCGTSDFNGDGDVGTDGDIEAFFACLAGDCCATCFSGGADFNADGDSGTDADIEAFFRVLAGGAC